MESLVYLLVLCIKIFLVKNLFFYILCILKMIVIDKFFELNLLIIWFFCGSELEYLVNFSFKLN